MDRNDQHLQLTLEFEEYIPVIETSPVIRRTYQKKRPYKQHFYNIYNGEKLLEIRERFWPISVRRMKSAFSSRSTHLPTTSFCLLIKISGSVEAASSAFLDWPSLSSLVGLLTIYE